MEVLRFPLADQQAIAPYLPPLRTNLLSGEGAAEGEGRKQSEVEDEDENEDDAVQTVMPFVTLTYASSLDSQISLTSSAPTVLSGPESKAMTHYLRANHDGILVGVGTAIADNPTLNSRISEAVNVGISLQPRPVILDGHARWQVDESSKVIKAAKEGKGKGPWILIDAAAEDTLPKSRKALVEACGGAYIVKVPGESWLLDLRKRGLKSIMIEGGGSVINDLLSHKESINSLILTLAPVFLGVGGVRVCPERSRKRKGKKQPAVRLKNVRWLPMGKDVVMCGKIDF